MPQFNESIVGTQRFFDLFPHNLYLTTEKYLPGSQPPKHKLTVFASNNKQINSLPYKVDPRADDLINGGV